MEKIVGLDRLRRRRGFTTIETLIALAIGLGVVLGIGGAAYGLSNYLGTQASYVATRTSTDAFVEQLQNDAVSAIAIYVPPTCGAVDASCSEIRFYAQDAAGSAHFWGYLYSSASDTIERCTYSSWNASCTQNGNAATGVTSFSASMKKVTDLNLPELSGYTPTDVAIEQINPSQDTGGNVMAGNRVAVVDVATKWQAQDIHLLAGGKPFRLDVVMNTVTPPPTVAPTPTPSVDPTSTPTPLPPLSGAYDTAPAGGWVIPLGSSITLCSDLSVPPTGSAVITTTAGGNWSEIADPNSWQSYNMSCSYSNGASYNYCWTTSAYPAPAYLCPNLTQCVAAGDSCTVQTTDIWECDTYNAFDPGCSPGTCSSTTPIDCHTYTPSSIGELKLWWNLGASGIKWFDVRVVASGQAEDCPNFQCVPGATPTPTPTATACHLPPQFCS